MLDEMTYRGSESGQMADVLLSRDGHGLEWCEKALRQRQARLPRFARS
jgi:hypothetical protein